MCISARRFRSLFFCLVFVIICIAVLLSIAAKDSDTPKIYVRKYRLRHPDQKISVAIGKTLRGEFADPPPSFFSRFRRRKKIKKPKTQIIFGTTTELGIVFLANKSKQKQVDKVMKEKFGKLLRPENLYDLKSVATIDTFAENVRKITKDVFTRQKFIFLIKQDIDAIAADLGDFVKTYTRSDVPNELRIRILDALDMYLYYNFRAEKIRYQERIYLDFDSRIKSLKMKLWQVIAKKPLTKEEKQTFEKQKKWIYDQAKKIIVDSELNRIVEMNRVDIVFEDVLNGFSLQPMEEKMFDDFKKKLLAEKEMNHFACTAETWSTQIGMKLYNKNYNRRNGKWKFPFAVVNGFTGRGDNFDYDFVSEKPYLSTSVQLYGINRPGKVHAYDITTRWRKIKIPESVETSKQLVEWLTEQDKGDFYYDLDNESILCCRGARMAVLDVHNFIESDKVPTEKLVETIKANPITEFSVSGYKVLGDFGSSIENYSVVPMLAVESKTGEIVVLRFRNMDHLSTYPLSMTVRCRFDGWDKLWFDSFITGELKEHKD